MNSTSRKFPYWTTSWGYDVTLNAAVDTSVTAAPHKGLNEGQIQKLMSYKSYGVQVLRRVR